MKAFDKLSQAEKRVVIAKDALRYLNAGKISPTCGAVIKYDGMQAGQPLREAIKKLKKPCEVCQRGGLLYAYVMKVNAFNLPSLRVGYSGVWLSGVANEHNPTNSKLEEVFDKHQLALIERAFEGAYNEKELHYSEQDACDLFYRKYTRDQTRFKAILNNIIKNKGTFVLPS